MNDPRYPIGPLERKATLTPDERRSMIARIAAAPKKLREAVAGLSDEQLETPYRKDGWTLRQVVHHVPESHMNAYIRFKLALTEDEPTIKPYDETRWAELEDVRTTPIETSVALLESLHDRWSRLLATLSESDFKRTLIHPENGLLTIDSLLSIYSWHGDHHVAHITTARANHQF